MGSRLELHDLLLSIGGPNVYYQVPSNMILTYPAIMYSIDQIENRHADDLVYNQEKSYSITVMSKDADYDVVDTISKLPKCRYDRQYIVDNIYHTVFIMYY